MPITSLSEIASSKPNFWRTKSLVNGIVFAATYGILSATFAQAQPLETESKPHQISINFEVPVMEGAQIEGDAQTQPLAISLVSHRDGQDTVAVIVDGVEIFESDIAFVTQVALNQSWCEMPAHNFCTRINLMKEIVNDLIVKKTLEQPEIQAQLKTLNFMHRLNQLYSPELALNYAYVVGNPQQITPQQEATIQKKITDELKKHTQEVIYEVKRFSFLNKSAAQQFIKLETKRDTEDFEEIYIRKNPLKNFAAEIIKENYMALTPSDIAEYNDQFARILGALKPNNWAGPYQNKQQLAQGDIKFWDVFQINFIEEPDNTYVPDAATLRAQFLSEYKKNPYASAHAKATISYAQEVGDKPAPITWDELKQEAEDSQCGCH